MMLYRKKPIEVEAQEWQGDFTVDGENIAEPWIDAALEDGTLYFKDQGDLYIKTLEGDMHCSVGDFIIKGINGELYACAPDIFWKTYEAATIPGLPRDYGMMTRDEVYDFFIKNIKDDVTQVGRLMRFIDDVFVLQNNVRQRVFIFEVNAQADIDINDYMQQLADACRAVNVVAVIVPTDTFDVKGQIVVGGWKA